MNNITEIHFFKPSGKWAYTAKFDMTHYYNYDLIHDAIRQACWSEFDQPNHGQWGLTSSLEEFLSREGWTAVCIKPYHKHSHPVMFKSNV